MLDRARIKALKDAPSPPPKPKLPVKPPKPQPPQAKAKKPPDPPWVRKKPKPPKPLPEPPARVRLRPRAIRLGAVDCTLPKWASPFRIAEDDPEQPRGSCKVIWMMSGSYVAPEGWEPIPCPTRRDAQRVIVDIYRAWLHHPNQAELLEDAKRELKGRLLACLCNCKPGKGGPCHVDVLLGVANS